MQTVPTFASVSHGGAVNHPQRAGVTHRGQPPSCGWQANLSIALELRGDVTRVVGATHRGPLRIQRPFYPEGDGTSHVYVLHPPGGVVGGDAVALEAECRSGARALLTTPAATKLYRSAGPLSRLRQTLRVSSGAVLEWLPQETIAFAGAHAELDTVAVLEDGAQFIGWEILCLGRPASGDVFPNGKLTQNFEVWRGDIPLYLDRLSLRGGDVLTRAPWGLADLPVVGTLLLVSEHRDLAAMIRNTCLGDTRDTAVTCTDLEGATVVRYLGASVQDCWRAFGLVWSVCRPLLKGTPASPPRVWTC